MKNNEEHKELRSFGLIVGGIFAGIGIWPVVVHSVEPRWWALIVAGLLILPAVVYPAALFWPHKGWMFVGHILGWINTRIILGLVFYVVVTPIGIIRRMLGKDPMGRQIKPELETYRIKRDPRPPSHLTKQY
jgi:hypothetical protein